MTKHRVGTQIITLDDQRRVMVRESFSTINKAKRANRGNLGKTLTRKEANVLVLHADFLQY